MLFGRLSPWLVFALQDPGHSQVMGLSLECLASSLCTFLEYRLRLHLRDAPLNLKHYQPLLLLPCFPPKATKCCKQPLSFLEASMYRYLSDPKLGLKFP